MTARIFSIVILGALIGVPAFAQRGNVRRDPMTDKEVDQMREFRDQPDRRVKLLNSIIQKRADTLALWEKDIKSIKPEERGPRTHDLLEDITNLLDEFGDNVDTFLKEEADIRKPLQESLTMLNSLQSQLNGVKTADANKPWFPDYSFPLTDALEATSKTIDETKQAIREDEKIVQEKKEREKQRTRGPVKIR